ncbi:hypothetical protein Tco_0162740 [Tanacetum coccineum]
MKLPPTSVPNRVQCSIGKLGVVYHSLGIDHEQNADFYQIIYFLTGCSINYSLFVDPDLIGSWLQQFWATASLKVINDVPHIRAKVAGKKILISEATIRADLLFDDANGVDCFPKQVIWDLLRDIGYEGNLAQLTFSKPLFSPQWKYLVHVLLHCLSPKSTSWEQFGTNIASALVRSTVFEQAVRGSRQTSGLYSISFTSSKVFTFMRKHSPKFSCRITPLTPPMLEVITALAAEEEHSTSPQSKAASSARDAQGTAEVQGTASFHGTAEPQDTAEAQDTDEVQDTDPAQGTAAIPKSPNDYTPTDASQTSGGDEGLLDLYALNREVRRLKRQTLSQAKQILKLKTKLKKLSKFVQPVVKHHAFWVESQNLKKQKRRRKKQRKKVSSVKLGRNKDEGTLSEEHNVQEEDTAHPFFDDIVDKDAAVTPDLERKSDETEEVNIEEKEASNVKSGETEELDLETTQSTARQGTITPRTLNFEDEAGPSSPLRPIQVMESEEHLKAAEVLVAISRPRGLSIPGPIQSQPQQPTQGTDTQDFEKNAQDKESLEGISMITALQVIDSPDGEYLIIHRANNHFRAFDTLWEILHVLDRQDLYHLHRVVDDYYEHIPPTGLGLMLLGDLNIIWETAESSDDDFWKDQEEWEIIRWRYQRMTSPRVKATLVKASIKSIHVAEKRPVAEKNNLFEEKTKIFEEMSTFDFQILVMSDLEHSTITYTSISSDDGSLDVGSPGVTILGYDGLPMMLEDPYAYVEAVMQEPPPPDFVPKPVYPEFMPPEDDVLPTEEQPLPAAVSPTSDSPGYITESDPEEDPEEEDDEDPEEDPADYPTDRDDDEEEDLPETMLITRRRMRMRRRRT